MYYENLQSFFKSVIGYDGVRWESDLDKPDTPWLSHDMEKMLNNKVGYPSLLHLFTIITYLGYCVNLSSSGRPGNENDFKFFVMNILEKLIINIDMKKRVNFYGSVLGVN